MPHISFSELKNWNTCPWYHKLVNIEKLKIFQGNAYTAFGTAMHTVCEEKLLNETINEVETFELAFQNNWICSERKSNKGSILRVVVDETKLK